MDRKRAPISLTVLETKNEMRVHIRFARTCNIFRVRVVIVRMPSLSSFGKSSLTQIDGCQNFTLCFHISLLTVISLSTEVLCAKLPTSLVNGRVIGSSYSYNKQVTFACSSGYYIGGGSQSIAARTLRCKNNGLWSAGVPTCLGKRIMAYASCHIYIYIYIYISYVSYDTGCLGELLSMFIHSIVKNWCLSSFIVISKRIHYHKIAI